MLMAMNYTLRTPELGDVEAMLSVASPVLLLTLYLQDEMHLLN